MSIKLKDGRDTSTFTFQKVSNGKGRTALSVIQAYAWTYDVSSTDVAEMFGVCKIPVVMPLRKARIINAHGTHTRYFTNDEDLIELRDGKFAVSNQWDKIAFIKLVEAARSLRWTITQD